MHPAVPFLSACAVTGIPFWLLLRSGHRKIASLSKKNHELSSAVESFQYEVLASSGQIASVSEEISATLSENTTDSLALFQQTQHMSQLNAQVNGHLRDSVGVLRDLVGSITRTQTESSSMSSFSLSSKQSLDDGLQLILSVVSVIERLRSDMETTLVNMDRLHQTSEEIAAILTAVDAISKQTQLLALNASIESARAGEAGRGFSVVAEEIRKLSESTGAAVKNIHGLILHVQSEVSTVHALIADNSRQVIQGAELSRSVEGQLNAISGNFSSLNDIASHVDALTLEERNMALFLESHIKAMEDVSELSAESIAAVVGAVDHQKHRLEDMGQLRMRLRDASDALTRVSVDSGTDLSSGLQDSVSERVSEAWQAAERMTAQESFLPPSPDMHQKLLNPWLAAQDLVEAVWTNDPKGRFICSIPPAGIANAQSREWFQKALRGEDYISDVYISAITRRPCLTLARPLKDKDGTLYGVFGMDLKLS